MSAGSSPQAGVTTDEKPTCVYTGEPLEGSVATHYSSSGPDIEGVPMAVAAMRERVENGDDIALGPGMVPAPCYRATLPAEELAIAQDLRGKTRADFGSPEWQALCQLAFDGWQVAWVPSEPGLDIETCLPYKPIEE